MTSVETANVGKNFHHKRPKPFAGAGREKKKSQKLTKLVGIENEVEIKAMSFHPWESHIKLGARVKGEEEVKKGKKFGAGGLL